MPTLPSESHRHRRVAESFGVDAARYDRTRPRYPSAMIRAVAAPDMLDVGCGTGINARQFQQAGCRVLGVDPDPRMAAYARDRGLEVDVARFEDWDPAGRDFDAVVAGQAWHWVDPVVGAAKAASVLRPNGRLSVFWNVAQPPPEANEAFAEVHLRCLPAPLAERATVNASEAYETMCAMATDGIRQAGAFDPPQRWRFDRQHRYTRDEWLDMLPTQGLYTRLPPAELADLLTAVGQVIDDLGGSLTIDYTTVVVSAVTPARAVSGGGR